MIPIKNGRETLAEFSEFFKSHNFQVHALENELYVYLEFNSRIQSDLLELDKITSSVIM